MGVFDWPLHNTRFSRHFKVNSFVLSFSQHDDGQQDLCFGKRGNTVARWNETRLMGVNRLWGLFCSVVVVVVVDVCFELLV